MTLTDYISIALVTAPAALIACKFTQYFTGDIIRQRTALISAALAACLGPLAFVILAVYLPVITALASSKYLLKRLDNRFNLDDPV